MKELESAPKATTMSDEGGSKGEAKLLKMKAQMTSRIKALEKELQELRQVMLYFVMLVMETDSKSLKFCCCLMISVL